jgi:hypothetical protein
MKEGLNHLTALCMDAHACVRVKCVGGARSSCTDKKNGETSAPMFGRPRLLPVCFHNGCRSLNNDTLRAPMDVVSCSASSRALHLLPAQGCSFVLRFA